MMDLVEALALTPASFPLDGSPDGSRVRLVHLDEAAYARASFLDGRLITPGLPSVWTDWAAIEQAARRLPTRSHFILHVGHVGSTLLSRLMGEHPGLFSLREPALLREVAASPLGQRLPVLLALFSRTWRAGQTALIKATSFVSEIGPDLLDQTPQSRAILLTATPPVYLRSILGGEASRRESQALALTRRQRLEHRLGAAAPATHTLGEQIALNWLCEATALGAVADAHPSRCLWLDFDRVLADPIPWLAAAFSHLRVDPDALDLTALTQGPIMHRYAKGPEHAYDAALRRQVQDEAARTFGLDVSTGMAWLQRAADALPAVRGALGRAALAARAPLAADPEAS
ncbi:hypothetical protein [Caulobacter sp. S45]|uniref:hypothetical protein n=1 Tax=Caulobacter sp. S45 TaxID=1641861 RepID=UPI001C2D3F07|nr:hypothetical protein [Caulobacter sp. S45]